MAVEERDKALDLAVGQIEKQFGKGSVMRLGSDGSCRWIFEAGEEIVGLYPVAGGLLLSL